MTISLKEFAALLNDKSAPKDAFFTIADNALCIAGKKEDGKYWHSPVLSVDPSVSVEALGKTIKDGFARASLVEKASNK